MNNITHAFDPNSIQQIELNVPDIATKALTCWKEITNTEQNCIGGGFPRGLYMQQVMRLHPEMNDIDVFSNLSVERFKTLRNELEKVFGEPIRVHTGNFADEMYERGLIEFKLPNDLEESCAGVKSIQFNFGQNHPWATPFNFATKANIGTNQIAISDLGKTYVTELFLSDMSRRTMTMNQHRDWVHHDWERTIKSINKMRSDRPEFSGWSCNLLPEPSINASGEFWLQCKNEHRIEALPE